MEHSAQKLRGSSIASSLEGGWSPGSLSQRLRTSWREMISSFCSAFLAALGHLLPFPMVTKWLQQLQTSRACTKVSRGWTSIEEHIVSGILLYNEFPIDPSSLVLGWWCIHQHDQHLESGQCRFSLHPHPNPELRRLISLMTECNPRKGSRDMDGRRHLPQHLSSRFM